MKNINTLSKIFLYITLLSGSLWLGSYLSRLFLIYQIFDPEMIFKNYINDSNLEGILITIVPVFFVQVIMFYLMLFSFVIFLISSKLNLRTNGWLFITAMIVFITAPFEIYLTLIDIEIMLKINKGVFSVIENIELLKDRIVKLSGFPIIILLSYSSIIYFILFKPFQKNIISNET